MAGTWRRLGEWATKLESWLALLFLVTGSSAFAWLMRQWDLLAAQGWAATIIFSILSACLLMIALSLAYLGFARLRQPYPAPNSYIPQTPTLPNNGNNNRYAPVDGSVFSNQRIWLKDLIPDPSPPVISKCSFNSCVIIGPAVLILQGGYITGNTKIMDTDGDLENALIEIGPNKRKVGGVIQLNECVFKDCTFKSIGIIGDKTQLDVIRRIFKSPV